MTTTPAPAAAKVETADHVVYCRLSTSDVEEARRFAAEESRSMASFIRAMYRRGLADYKVKHEALRAGSDIVISQPPSTDQ